jgi:hypothetical protein
MTKMVSVKIYVVDSYEVTGGEGGIRTRVRVISPQTAFEAAPLRPLRYLSEIWFARWEALNDQAS